MAEITTASPTPVVPPASPPILQKIENAIFAFLQAHYSKALTGVIGWLIAHFGLIGKFL